MVTPSTKGPSQSLITKEFLIGLAALGLGGYNLGQDLGLIKYTWKIPQLAGNILLVLAGLFLWLLAFRLWRQRYHTRNIF